MCALCCSVAFPSASSCVDDLDESRSLRLKDLLSDYFDKRRDLSQMLAPVYIEELDKYKVNTQEGYQELSAELVSLNVLDVEDYLLFLCVCSFQTGRIRSERTSEVFSPTGVMRSFLEELLLESSTA